jgi:hypothetical protein
VPAGTLFGARSLKVILGVVADEVKVKVSTAKRFEESPVIAKEY